MSLEIYTGASQSVSLADGSQVSLSELSWTDALVFIKKVAGQASQFLTSDGKLSINLEKFAEVVAGSQDLAEWLILKSSGKDQAWLSARSFNEGLDLLDGALALNLRPDFFSKLKRIGSRFLAGNNSAPSSISSSGKDTAGPTS